MNYITLSQDKIFLKYETEIELKRSISKNEISFFNFSFLDTSRISISNFGTDFTNYVVQRTSQSSVTGTNFDYNPDIFRQSYSQNR